MKPGQIVVIVLAVVAVGVAALLATGGGKKSSSSASSGSGSTPTTAPSGSVVVKLATSPEKFDLLKAQADQFNGSSASTVNGKRVFVQVANASSGDEELSIAKAARGGGGDQPVVWSPSSSLWGRLLNDAADKTLVADTNPSIFRTPLVIAMWEPLARALGWPKKQLGWSDILRLAQNKRGWAAYGHPEFGKFKLVHTNPSVSTAGLESVTAEYYAAAHKAEGLTDADLHKPAVRRAIQGIERSIVHYGDTTIYIADQLRKEGPGYASAVALEEATLVQFNQNRGGQPKLVAIYPKEGTFYSDDPYLVLNAPWVTADQKAGAAAFQKYLASNLSPQQAAQGGFRPAALNQKPLPPVDVAHGVNPALPRRLLSLPEPRVMTQIQRSWLADRKPANIELVLDISGSMNDEGKLPQAKRGLAAFFSQLSPRDRVGLETFSDQVTQVAPIRPFGATRAELRRKVASLFAGGQTSLYDATAEGYNAVSRLNDSSRINAVVLLTDGMDTGSTTSLGSIVGQLRKFSQDEGTKIRIYTIAYGSGADRSPLDEIAAASGGKSFIGDPTQIEQVYRSISSFF